MSMAWILPCRS
ncbi:hypothetical protein F383_16234 [Gossypium arboreum]|uniref:Uncharacterized protein n=1 Tax=Gossypium arboreum TaxID=29729 RepID=A0A0B0PQT1_GOSAR|nr:hypothetical protein F383_16234 [Gossypium arboreum]